MGYVKIPQATNRTVDFTSSGTWTCPAGVYSAEFLVVGAGGAGGGSGATATFHNAGGGGGGGAVKKIILTTTPATSYTITIGAKGTGSAATAGGNGGYTEVLNGATVLVRSFGGTGGAGIDASNNEVLPTATATIGGGGGRAWSSNNSNTVAGGAGGALASFGTSTGGTAVFPWTTPSAGLSLGVEGAHGRNGASSTTISYSYGGTGIDGYGAGGGGGSAYLAAVTGTAGVAGYGAGNGASRITTGSTAGSAALANTGGGGGGSSSHTNTSSVAGGNGSDGIVRITYFA